MNNPLNEIVNIIIMSETPEFSAEYLSQVEPITKKIVDITRQIKVDNYENIPESLLSLFFNRNITERDVRTNATLIMLSELCPQDVKSKMIRAVFKEINTILPSVHVPGSIKIIHKNYMFLCKRTSWFLDDDKKDFVAITHSIRQKIES